MLFLALRQLFSRKGQSLLILLGVVLGTAAYVIISGMMLGFQDDIIDKLVNNNAQITITTREHFLTKKELNAPMFGKNALVKWLVPPGGRTDNMRIQYPIQWYQRLDNTPEVSAYTPEITVNTVMSRGKTSASSTLVGCDPLKIIHVTSITKYMTQGSFNTLRQGGNRIVVGEGLLKKMGARVSDTIMVSNKEGKVFPFKITGVFQFGIQNIDDATAFTSLADAQKVNQTPGQISEIAVKLHDPNKARELAAQWASISPEKVQSWQEVSANVLSIFKTQDFIRYFMTLSILLVAGFGIYNVLNVLITQKKRDIAILRAMGYTAKDIAFLFLTQGMLLGILGGLIGLAIGFGACKYVQSIKMLGNMPGSNGHMIVSFLAKIYIQGFLLAFLSSIISSYLPSRTASKLTPIGIIRSE